MKKSNFLAALVLLLCISSYTYAQATFTLGGDGSTTDKIKMTVNRGGNFQVRYNNQNQIFAPSSDSPGADNNVPGTLQGIVLSIGNKYWHFGSLGSYYSDEGVIAGFTNGGEAMSSSDITHTASKTGTSGGLETFTMVHTITHNAKQYIFTVKYEYMGSGTEVKSTYTVQAPAGNTEVIKMAHAWDSYLTGGDSGPGSYVGPRGDPGETVSVTKGCDSYQGFQYVSGTTWSGHYSALYSAFTASLANDMNFGSTSTDGIVDADPSTDNGVGISIDFGTPAGTTVESVNKLIFAPNKTAPTLASPATANNNCSSATPNVVTEADAKAIITSGTSTVKFYTSATPAAGNEVTFPITANTTIYAANTLGSCIFDVSAPITVEIVQCCQAGSAAPTLSATTLATDCASGNKANLSTITASNLPSGATLTWHTASPATDANKIANVTSLSAGTYHAAFYDATNTCYNSGGTSTITVTESSCSEGTINCDGVVLVKPTNGTANQYTLLVPINVTVAGCFSITNVTGAGMSLPSNITTVCTDKTGSQQLSIPLNYDGTTALSNASVSFTIGTTACSLQLNAATNKKAVVEVWTNECMETCGPTLQ